MKKRAPGWQKKEQKRKQKPFPENTVAMSVSRDGEGGWDALMERLKTGESTVFFFDEDLEVLKKLL